MLKNYLTIAFRHLMRNKIYSAINILGLAVGIACCLVILLYVNDELSYDTFHKDGDQIYRMALNRKYPGRVRSYAITPHSYAQAIKEELPEVEESVRVFYFQGANLLFKIGETTYEEKFASWADSNFFDFMGMELLEGNPKTALVKPNTVVLTESVAKKYFGNQNPLGKILDIPNNDQDLEVTGVCPDVPVNSHMKYDLLQSSASMGNFIQQPNYVNFSAYTYLKLNPAADPATVESKLPDLVRKYASGPVQRQFGVNYDEYVAAGNGYEYFLQPIKDIHLHSNLEAEFKAPGSITRVYIFTVIAFFILIIGIINFMNLATARATERAKEVGIRKTLGSLRKQLVTQFLLEATMISLISAGLSLVFLNYLLPLFNNLAGTELSIWQIINPTFLLAFLAFGLLVGLLAGSYPAVILSSFNPLQVLKGKLISTKHGVLLRNGLVVFQFTISVILIISTIVVFNQMQYIQQKELGFNKEQILTIQGANALQTQAEAFKEELLKLPTVTSLGTCNSMPGGQFFGTSFRKEGSNETMFGSGIVVDDDFINCMQMELIDGRGFTDEFNDSLSLVINETAARELQLENPVNQRVSNTNPDPQTGEEITTFFTIVGVVKDFHFQSLHQVISPIYFYNSPENQANNLMTVRIAPGNFQSTIQGIESTWERFLPDQPFRFTFLDADLAELYQAEQIAQKVFSLFSLLAIFIACMGLLGLAAYMTQQRTKEIGIRKVLGASATNIVTLLSKDFLKLVGIALFIAIPVAWYWMNGWLNGFAYSIRPSWWMFALAGGIAILIAFLTVSYQSVRAAFANPIKALKDE